MTATRTPAESRPWGVGALVATVTGNMYLVIGTLAGSILALVVCWIPPRGRMVFRVARAWSHGVLASSGVRLSSDYAVELDPRQRYIFMANHQSLFDIPALIVAAPTETRFLAKRSLFQIPLFGWALAAGGFVSVDRRGGGRAHEGFRRALEQLRSGASILVFPEGTRSLDGRLLPFKRGGLLLALRSGLPIVPVGVRGTLEIRRRGSYRIDPGPIAVRYGRPIDPGEFGVRELRSLEATLRERIAELAAAP